jgi:signal transduction histidine kinase
MTWVYPTDQARVTTRLGVESAFFWVSTVFLGGAAISAIAHTIVTGSAVWATLAGLVGLWALLVLGERWSAIPVPLIGVVLVMGAVLVWMLVATLPAGSSEFVPLAALIATTALGMILDRWSGTVGTLVGYGLAAGAVFVAGGTFDVAALVVAVCVAAYNAMLTFARGEGRSVSARLDAAGLTEIASSERRTLELRSRALVHDTVLGELAAIGLMDPGPLSPGARASIRASLDAVRLPTGVDDGTSTPSAAIASLLERMSKLGVEVTLSGDPGALDLLAPDARDALVLAMDQALVNVATHARTPRAELSIIHSGESVVVTIVDDGVGFDQDAVAHDRFGFRESIRGRVEAAGGSARILSKPGHGTSIVLMCDIPEVSA